MFRGQQKPSDGSLMRQSPEHKQQSTAAPASPFQESWNIPDREISTQWHSAIPVTGASAAGHGHSISAEEIAELDSQAEQNASSNSRHASDMDLFATTGVQPPRSKTDGTIRVSDFFPPDVEALFQRKAYLEKLRDSLRGVLWHAQLEHTRLEREIQFHSLILSGDVNHEALQEAAEERRRSEMVAFGLHPSAENGKSQARSPSGGSQAQCPSLAPSPAEGRPGTSQPLILGTETDGGNGNELRTLFQPNIQMTPVRVRKHSPYIRFDAQGNVAIQAAAYTRREGRLMIIPCRAVRNAGYFPSSERNAGDTLLTIYIGFVFPDETSLFYLPLKNITLVRASYVMTQQAGTFRGSSRGFVRARMDAEIFHRVCGEACAKLHEEYPGAFVDRPSQRILNGSEVLVDVAIRGDRSLKVVDEMGGTGLAPRTYLKKIGSALLNCRQDITGDCQLQVQFNGHKWRPHTFQLRFILFGLLVTKNEANRHLDIFRQCGM